MLTESLIQEGEDNEEEDEEEEENAEVSPFPRPLLPSYWHRISRY